MEQDRAVDRDRSGERRRMVARQLRSRGIADERVLAAMESVPRHVFVSGAQASDAYADSALPIADDQTISQPYIVALMAEALHLGPGDRVLEIGAGSGYAAAVLARLASSVVAVERVEHLAGIARRNLAAAGVTGVEVVVGDGTLGWPEHAPYDAISVAAAGPAVPQPLLDQLADGGRLVMPVGTKHGAQRLVVVHRRGDRLDERSLGAVRFVPLVGESGWHDR